MKKKDPYRDPWTQTFPQDLIDEYNGTSRASGSVLTERALNSMINDAFGGGVNTLVDEKEEPGVQLWDKLQELLPGTKTECPIRKKIEVQPLDPYDKIKEVFDEEASTKWFNKW